MNVDSRVLVCLQNLDHQGREVIWRDRSWRSAFAIRRDLGWYFANQDALRHRRLKS